MLSNSFKTVFKIKTEVFREIRRSLGFFSKKNEDNQILESESQTSNQPHSVVETVPERNRPLLPLITQRDLQFLSKVDIPRQAWVQNLDTVESEILGMVDLHPTVFGEFPRMDILHQNVQWQRMYRKVNYEVAKTRAEKPGGGRKPWPQKGTGRARHGSIRSPIFKGGGIAHGPRGPETYFYMLPFYSRVKGLTSALSVKHAQDDLKIVDTLEIQSDDPKYLEDLVTERHWGPSVLFIDDTDFMSKNIALATNEIKHMNLMPVYGLNVYSMLKHETLVITLSALEKIEERILFHLNRQDWKSVNTRYIR